MSNLISRYRRVPAAIWWLIGAQFVLYLVNSGFMLIGNIYLRKSGFMDPLIASITSYRFLGALILAFPLGLYIRGKRLKPYFMIAAIMVPIAGYGILVSVDMGLPWLTKLSFLLVGCGFMLMQVCSLPFIMRTAPKGVVTEAFSLSFATWSFSMIVTGLLINFLSKLDRIGLALPGFEGSERQVLATLIFISLLAIFGFANLQEGSPKSRDASLIQKIKAMHHEYDWDLLAKALVPTVIISVGAGLTIPFLNLFFFSVFNLDSAQYSMLGSLSSVLVILASLIVPALSRRFGYRFVVINIQLLAVFFLILLSLSELVSPIQFGLYLAIGCFLLRQPLMNMVNPAISELTMEYVGERNQELISAVNSSIWSASWFFSAKIFQYLRAIEMPYYKIFLMTAGLYSVGISLYLIIIREYSKRPNIQEIDIVTEIPVPANNRLTI